MRLNYETNKAPNVGKVASGDASQPVLTQINYDTERGVVEATDSYMLVCVTVEVEDGDVSGLIPPDAWAKFYKAHKRHQPAPSLRCTAEEIVLESTYDGTRQTWRRPDVGTFPNFLQLIPEEANLSGFRIGLNAKHLAKLAEGLGSSDGFVELRFIRGPNTTEEGEGVGYFPSPLRPMLVKTTHCGESIGLLMPIRLASQS